MKMTGLSILTALALSGSQAAFAGDSALERAAAFSAAAAQESDMQKAALLASSAMDGRGLAAPSPVSPAGAPAVPSGLRAAAVSDASPNDLKAPSPISWLSHPRPRPKKPGFWHRFTRTTAGELFFLGLLAFAIGGACMFGGAALMAAAFPGSGLGLAGGLFGALGGAYLAGKVVKRLEK